MYQQKGKLAYNAKLDNIKLFSQHLNNPHKKFKSIHVAGTNGKGSSSHMLASIFQEAGYTVGLYTSPHLKDYRERIKINDQPISKTEVVDFIVENKSFLDKHHLSFFEMSVGLAFHCFARHKVDIAIVEVGLGGRLDSTNIITPEISLITNISYDHADILGASLAEIATEKAGIIKDGIPVIISETQIEVAKVFESVADQKNAQLVFADEVVFKSYQTDLLGHYQIKNIKGVVAVLKNLESFKINEDHIEVGLQNVVKNTGILGRWQILQNKPMIVCDTAHNFEGLSQVLKQIRQQHFNQIHIVLGFVKDKDLDALLPLFPKQANYYFSKLKVRRGLNVEILKKKARENGLKGTSYDSVMQALMAAKQVAVEDDFVFVGGSTFTVAEVV